MAYNLIAQVDENESNYLAEPADRSPGPIEPPASTDHAHESVASGQHGLGKLINSINNKTNDYEMVEDDDYDEIAAADATIDPTAPSTVAASFGADQQARSPSPEPLVRTSSDVSIPLRHPTPDLQSLQGAYVGNVERLEKSAERLSMTSSDIGVELRKLDLEQKRRSSASSAHQGQGPESPSRQPSIGSLSNSIIAVNSAARSGGYSPAAFLSSPRGSILSGSRFRSTSVTSPLQDIHEPKQEDDMELQERDVPILTPIPLPPHLRKNEAEAESPDTGAAEETDPEVLDRPLTAHSTDTYQQATDLFLDFDGVHFVPHPKQTALSRRVSLNKATTAEHYKVPQAGQDLIYYPAPIPKLLNLPQRLSKQPAGSKHEKRRTQLMNIITDSKQDTTKATNDAADPRVSKRLSTLPPQLRASVFFDQPSSHISSLGVQLKDQSAVSTLDSILDASTHAPVSAFVDHPIVGSAGANIYAPAVKKRASRLSLGKNTKDASRKTPGPRESALLSPSEHDHTGHSDTEGSAQRDPSHSDDEDWDDHHSHSHSSDEDASSVGSHGSEGDEADEDVSDKEYETEEPMLFGRPTTLLAELQMRKQEQRQRTRTAANAFPNGMHSTLLELDAVAQAQSNKRRQKLVTLAWETEAAQQSDEADDEDIPLGMLYGNKDTAADERRPLGLMERREMEENEPLSKRRARLRGEHVPTTMPNKRASTMTQLKSMAAAEPDSGDDGETLGQRLRRLKQEKKEKSKSIVSLEFENEIMAELGKLHEPVEHAAETPAAPAEPVEKAAVNEEEETLGQRRRRLQAEQKTQGTRNMRASRSMADILQAYPASNTGFPAMGNFHDRRSSMLNPGSIHTQRLSTGYTGTGYPTMRPGHDTQPAYGNIQYKPSFMPGGINVYHAGMQYPHNAAMMQQNIDPGQRDVIDRWRQSVR